MVYYLHSPRGKRRSAALREIALLDAAWLPRLPDLTVSD
jgi:hypothetical protein